MKSSKTLETCCYVVCYGAFGIFVRWMQLMIAYNDESLVDSSFWSAAVIILIAASAFTYLRFNKQFQDKYYYVPHDFCSAFKNDTQLHAIFRWSICGVMVVGSLLLLMQCEVDRDANFLRILAVLGIIAGFSFGMLLTAANRPSILNQQFVSFLSAMPILLTAFWTLTVYKQNSINPVSWDYAVELTATIFSMLGFFRMAGFSFGVFNEWRSLFFSMLGSTCCLMNLADSRYIGEQIMFFAMAAMLLMFAWLLLENMKKGQPANNK